MPNDNDRFAAAEEHLPHDQSAARFGTLLRELRESYFTRVTGPREAHGPSPRVKLSSLSVISCMREAGYPISSATYTLIEQGTNLPKNVAGFLRAIRSCLRLNDADYSMLVYLLTYDLVYPRLGDLADYVLRPESLLANTLSVWRGMRGISVVDLATGLIECGFAPTRASDHDTLAMFLTRMEQGARWPFDEADIDPFIAAYAQCVGERTIEPLKKALADEIRLNAYIRSNDQLLNGHKSQKKRRSS